MLSYYIFIFSLHVIKVSSILLLVSYYYKIRIIIVAFLKNSKGLNVGRRNYVVYYDMMSSILGIVRSRSRSV